MAMAIPDRSSPMTKFNFLADRTKPAPTITRRTPKIRRTGIGKIVAEIQIANPTWPESRVEAQAKAVWAQRDLERRKR